MMQKIGILLAVWLCSTGLFLAPAFAAEPLPWANPWDVGMDYEYVNRAFSELAKEIQSGAAPGAVGLVLKEGKIIARRAVGQAQTHLALQNNESHEITYVPYSGRMLEDTLFDLASLTKMIATTTSILILVDQGQIDLDKTVASYIPAFAARAKDKVTVRHLITHTSGLPSWFPFYQIYIDREEVFRSLDEDFALETPPGAVRVYSDLGFIVLGRLVEVVSGKRLDRFAQEYIFGPLGMTHTGFLPSLPARYLAAPTELDPGRDGFLKGIVHDENSRALSGVSGHAGLFSTATDLALFAQMLLNKGELHGRRILKEATVQAMLKSQLPQSAIDKGSAFLRNRKQLIGWWGMDDKITIGADGGLPSQTAFGHTGFTGTSFYVDPEHNAAAILLSNAIHPKREDANRSALRRAFYVNISKALVGSATVNVEPEYQAK
ncbi:MAG: serine hydrolase [Candidatus Omnitrophica bacterium]|nr:serine hydrolase [Candidatus Omnitrophota bacterium]HPP01207.1 serine hydrolase [bacterium]